MKKEKKFLNFKFISSNVAAVFVGLGGVATVKACTFLFHEKKVPQELLENNPFISKK